MENIVAFRKEFGELCEKYGMKTKNFRVEELGFSTYFGLSGGTLVPTGSEKPTFEISILLIQDENVD